MSNKNKILILGGEGFIGRNIADFFKDEYECFSVGFEETIFNKGRKDEFIKLDPYKEKIENDYGTIIHLIDNGVVGGEDFEFAEANLIRNIDLNKNNHLILFSSAVIYANPNSDYGQRKILLEEIYEKYCKKNGIKLTIFRLFNIYGPYQIPFKQGSLVANIFCNYLNKSETEINDLSAKRDFIYSKDMVKFIKYAIENGVSGIFDLATNKLITLGELINEIEKVVGKKLTIRDNRNKEMIVCPEAKNTLIKEVETSLIQDGLRETFEFYIDNKDAIKKI